MSTPRIDPVLLAAVVCLKEAHFRWRSRMAWAISFSFIAGTVVGLGTWFMQKPMNRDEIMLGGVLGLGSAVFFIGGRLTRMIYSRPDIKCPQCEHDWQGSDPNDDWLTWKCCPGCGLAMSDDASWQEKS